MSAMKRVTNVTAALLAIATVLVVLGAYLANAQSIRPGGGGSGGGGVAGTISSGQVAYGTAADTIGGDSGMTYVAASDALTVGTVEATGGDSCSTPNVLVEAGEGIADTGTNVLGICAGGTEIVTASSSTLTINGGLTTAKNQNAQTLVTISNTTNGASAAAGLYLTDGDEGGIWRYVAASNTFLSGVTDALAMQSDQFTTGGLVFAAGYSQSGVSPAVRLGVDNGGTFFEVAKVYMVSPSTGVFNISGAGSISSGNCNADEEVGSIVRYSKGGGTDISICVCEKDASSYVWAAVSGTGDCT